VVDNFKKLTANVFKLLLAGTVEID